MAASGRSNGHDLGPEAFVHLDVVSAFSRLQSPSTPRDYVSALTPQFPLNERTAGDSRPALAICDWGLQSAVKTAVACHRAGVDHLLGLRLRVVPEAAWHPWAEHPRELLLIAGDDEAWLALVALSNLAHLSNADFRGPRVDWRDLEQHCRGELICLTGAPMVGVLSPLVEHAADPSNPTEAMPLTRRLAELFPHLYIELAYHHHPREKLINRGLVALAQRLDLPLVATNAVRFARKQDALTSSVLEAIGRRRRAVGVIGSTDGDGPDVPVVSVDDAYRAEAYLKSPNEMHRLFAQLPAALSATAEIRALAKFLLPLACNTPPEQRYGPARLFGLDPVRDMDRQRLVDLVERALPERFAETGRGEPSVQVREQAATEARAICDAGLAELLLVAYDVGQFCKQHGIPRAARGSATSSLVAWALGLVELCPLDHGLDAQLFVHQGRGDLPDLDLEVSSLHEPAVSAFVARYGSERLGLDEPHDAGSLPRVGTLRLGINVSFGARQAVRSVGVALGVDPIRINSLARQVPLLSSPGAVEQVLTRSPEMGGSLSVSSEPGLTILRVAGSIEGLPQRFGAHPSAYAVSFHGPGALSWLPAHWVSADRPGRTRVRGPRHLAMGTQSRPEQAELAHPSAVAPNDQMLGGPPGGADDQDGMNPSRSALDSLGSGPVLACAWGVHGKKMMEPRPSRTTSTHDVLGRPERLVKACMWS